MPPKMAMKVARVNVSVTVTKAKPTMDPAAAKKEAKAQKKAAKKDPNAPKRARSAYIIFTTDEGKKVREANPEMSAPEVLREIGRRWGQF